MVFTQNKVFRFGYLVYVRKYISGDHGLPGKKIEVQGSVLFIVLLKDGRNVKKHTYQIVETCHEEAESADANLIEDDTVIPEDNLMMMITLLQLNLQLLMRLIMLTINLPHLPCLPLTRLIYLIILLLMTSQNRRDQINYGSSCTLF
uniref:Uncharacterized protein n=1 Tax=Amphimedon queenslandica TaxID=400682 RepID=A0A1X7VW79_AMPQE